MQEGRPLAYLSQGLKGKNLFLSTYEKELLALVMAVRKWRHYLLGQTFVVRTDQQALKYLLKQRIGTLAQQKWVSKLLGYDFRVEYKRGRENKAADALSRVPFGEIEDNDAGTPIESVEETYATNQSNLSQSQLQAISTIRADWLEELRKTYPEDPMIQELLQQLQEEALSPTKFNLLNGLLFYKGRLHLGSLVPIQQQILHQFHSSPLAGHMGNQKTYSKV
jgi:hypothetical protein